MHMLELPAAFSLRDWIRRRLDFNDLGRFFARAILKALLLVNTVLSDHAKAQTSSARSNPPHIYVLVSLQGARVSLLVILSCEHKSRALGPTTATTYQTTED